MFKLDDLPAGCGLQTTGLAEFESVATLSPTDLVAYFSANPQAARRVLQQSYDKRYSPSTFIEETHGGYQVGWFDRDRAHLVHFTELEQAVADYLLFSFGRGRLRTT